MIVLHYRSIRAGELAPGGPPALQGDTGGETGWLAGWLAVWLRETARL